MTFQSSRSQGKPYFANDLERRIRIEQQLKFLAVGPVQTHCWLAIVSAHNSCNIIRHNSCNLANRHLFLSKYFSSKFRHITYQSWDPINCLKHYNIQQNTEAIPLKWIIRKEKGSILKLSFAGWRAQHNRHACPQEGHQGNLGRWIIFIFRCASISWFQVVTQWVSNLPFSDFQV